jgi:hypothetical protein
MNPGCPMSLALGDMGSVGRKKRNSIPHPRQKRAGSYKLKARS